MKIKVFALICSVFIIMMLFSTNMIILIRNKEIEIEESGPINGDYYGNSFISIDYFYIADELYDTISMKGAIYNISDASDEESTKSLILSASNNSYRLTLVEFITTEYTRFAKFDKKIKNHAGFAIDFCPLGIDDGTYNIILQIEENGEPVTRAKTGYYIIKDNGHVNLLYSPSQSVKNIETAPSGAGAGFQSMELSEDGTLNLVGWGLIPEQSADNTNVFVKVKSGGKELGTFSTTKTGCIDVANFYGNKLYFSCGFEASIKGVDSKDIIVDVFVEYEGKIYQVPAYFFPNEAFDNLEYIHY